MPSRTPIHSRYTGMSLCSTGTTSTSGPRFGSAPEVVLEHPEPASPTTMQATAAQVSILLLNVVVISFLKRPGAWPGRMIAPATLDHRAPLNLRSASLFTPLVGGDGRTH